MIVNWNTRDLLRDCLRSLAGDTGAPPAEIIVVDNASSDGSAQMLTTEFPTVRLLPSPTNLGFARASNWAAREAQGEVLVFLNPDTIVPEGALARLVDALLARPEFGAAGPRLTGPAGEPREDCMRFPSLGFLALDALGFSRLFPHHPRLGAYRMGGADRARVSSVDWVGGACLAVRREIFRAVGGFDEDFFLFGEDVDLCRRMREAGHGVLYAGTARVIHLGGAAGALVRPRVQLEGFRALYLYFRKHRPRWQLPIFRSLMFMGSLLRILVAVGGYVPAVFRGRRAEAARRIRAYARALALALSRGLTRTSRPEDWPSPR